MYGARWSALTDTRREQVRILSLAGVMVTIDDVIIYAMEGGSKALDDFLRLLAACPCQAVTSEVWREAVRFRFQRVLTLSEPILISEEMTALRRALRPDDPAYCEIPPLLGAAAMRWTMLPYRTRLKPTNRLVVS